MQVTAIAHLLFCCLSWKRPTPCLVYATALAAIALKRSNVAYLQMSARNTGIESMAVPLMVLL